MQKVIILSGLPGSGKSTYANETFYYGCGVYEIINWDRLRHFDIDGNPRPYRFTEKSEKQIRLQSFQMAEKFLQQGKSLIIDNTNLNQSSIEIWTDIAQKAGAVVEVKEFNTSLDECIRRNELRTGWRKVPRPVIERMALWNNRIDWPKDKKVVIVDLDGTLADTSHRDHFVTGPGKKDWYSFFSACENDTVHQDVFTTVYNLFHSESQHSYICIVSGRPLDFCGDATLRWLDKHEIPFHRIFMRNRGDSRDDTIIKKEILDKIGAARVSFAIDDRPKVIRMWRENGIKIYDVGDGVEF